MAWTDLDASPQWQALDSKVLEQSVYMLLENAGAAVDDNILSYHTTMFSPRVFIQYLYQRQLQFIKDTGIVVKRATQNVTPQQGRYDLPQDWMDTRRLDFSSANDSMRTLFRTDSYVLDGNAPLWQMDSGTPESYQEATSPLLQLDLSPTPMNDGGMILTYLGAPSRPNPTLPVGNPPFYYGNYMLVPDEFVPCVMYGALADLLNADGEGRDPKRAEYCQSRYQMGVELAKLMLEGA